MKVLLIDNYDSFTYNLVHYLEQLNAEVIVVRNDESYDAEITWCDRVVISPGPGLPKQSGQLMAMLKLAVEQKPILGVCLGLQAIVEYFGGMLKNLNEVHHGQQSELEIIDLKDPLFSGIPQKSKIAHYHSWVADRQQLPACLIETSRSLGDEIMSIRHSQLPIWAVQFHPESILSEHGLQLMKNWLTKT